MCVAGALVWKSKQVANYVLRCQSMVPCVCRAGSVKRARGGGGCRANTTRHNTRLHSLTSLPHLLSASALP